MCRFMTDVLSTEALARHAATSPLKLFEHLLGPEQGRLRFLQNALGLRPLGRAIRLQRLWDEPFVGENRVWSRGIFAQSDDGSLSVTHYAVFVEGFVSSLIVDYVSLIVQPAQIVAVK